jgi:hypothetical protein
MVNGWRDTGDDERIRRTCSMPERDAHSTEGIVYTERLTWSPVWWVVIFSPVILVVVLIALAGPEARGADSLVTLGIMSAILGAIAYAFRALRITIDDRQLTVGFPIWRDRVPLDQITACRPVRYRWWEFGGYGIRWGRRGKMYNVGGDGGRAVDLQRRGRGPLLFSSRNPGLVCAAIRARRPDIASV